MALSSSFPRKRESRATAQQIIALDPRFRGGDGQPIPATVSVASVFALVDFDDLVEHGQGLLLRPLEGVAADDRAVAAAVADRAHLGEDAVEVLGLAARKDDDAPAVKGGLHDMADACGGSGDVDLLLLVDRLRRGEFEMLGRRLDLDDVRAAPSVISSAMASPVAGALRMPQTLWPVAT